MDGAQGMRQLFDILSIQLAALALLTACHVVHMELITSLWSLTEPSSPEYLTATQIAMNHREWVRLSSREHVLCYQK